MSKEITELNDEEMSRIEGATETLTQMYLDFLNGRIKDGYPRDGEAEIYVTMIVKKRGN